MLTTAIVVHSCPSGSYVKALKKMRKGGGETIKLGICEECAMEKDEEFRSGASGAEHRACAVCDHNGRTDLQAVSNGRVAIIL